MFQPLPKPEKRGPKPRQPIRRVGKRTAEYERWKKNEAIPYLDSQGPRVCAKGCGQTWPLDVGHKKGRGAHPELRMELTNVEWQCPAFNRFGGCLKNPYALV